MFYATRDNQEEEEFWLLYFMMTTNMKDCISEDNEKFGKIFRDTMEGHFEHDFYNRSLSNQLESDETDTLQQRIECWIVVVDRVGPIPNKVYEYSFAELFNLYRKAIDPEKRELVKLLGDRQFIPKKTCRKAECIIT